jgi:hypothetical protein
MKKIEIPDAFPRISVTDLHQFDLLNHYDGNWLTAWHGQSGQDPKYGQTTKAPYHTNGVYDFGRIRGKTILMDTELINSGSLLENEYLTKKEHRIDVIRRIDLTPLEKETLALLIEEELGKEHLYGVARFGSFAQRLQYVGWAFKWMKPGQGQVVCSGRWVRPFERIQKPVSPYGFNETIPNDIMVYALTGPEKEKFEIYTLKLKGEYYDPSSGRMLTE